ncbi:uncharacterized protein UHOD_11532 [Ustilago sp. UG-2017b]|nr:uncharacterized protein UHOD_11532 [Ustilago sp. UG-2017b]
MEKIAESTLLNKVGKICMFQADIHKLIVDINEHWAKAGSMGHALPEILKVKTLINQAKYVTPITTVLSPSKTPEWHQIMKCFVLYYANTRTVSGVARLKPGICDRTASITDPIEICSSVFGITILAELCSRDVSMALLARMCNRVCAIAGFD